MKLETIVKVGNGLEKVFRHPAMNVLIMLLTMIAIPVTVQNAEEWYDVLFVLFYASVFLMNMRDFIDWRIKKHFEGSVK